MTRALLAVIALGLAAAPAAADDTVHLERGLTALDRGDFAAAAREFQAAYDADPQPRYLFDWALAERRAGDCTSALALYHRLLDAELSADQRTTVAASITVCEHALAHPPPRRRWYDDHLALGLAGGGAVALAIGGGFQLAYDHRVDDARAAAGYPDVDHQLDLARRDRDVAIGAYALGAGLAATAIARWIWPARDDGPSIAAAPTANGAALVVIGSF